jgi:hypothetical protein
MTDYSDMKDGINVNQAPNDFSRPDTPPAAPPPVICGPVKPLLCRCGREAEWVLDGSLFGCSSCFISGTSSEEWNALVGEDPAQPETQSGYESWKSGYAEGFRVGSKAAVDERLQIKAENERLRMQLVACGVIATSNTRESAARQRDMHPDYMSASCQEVIRAVDREIDLREERDQLKAEVERVKALNHSQFGDAIKRNAEVDALRKAITDINSALEREYWSEYAGLEETRAILDAAMSKERT